MKAESEVKRVERRECLFVKLTNGEIQERAKVAAELQSELYDAEFELKQANESAKREIKKIKSEISQAATAHNTGKEFQTVECLQAYDAAERRTWFEYKGEKYGERPMNDEEIREAGKTLFNDGPIHGAALNSDELAGKLPAEISNAKVAKSGKKGNAKVAEPQGLRVAPPDDPRVDAGYDPRGSDIAQVIREESSKKGKADHVSR